MYLNVFFRRRLEKLKMDGIGTVSAVSHLQEFCQKRKYPLPKYEEGPFEDYNFTTICIVEGSILEKPICFL